MGCNNYKKELMQGAIYDSMFGVGMAVEADGTDIMEVDGMGFTFPKIDFGEMLQNTVNNLTQKLPEIGSNILGQFAESELKDALGIEEGETTKVVTRTETVPATRTPSPQTPSPVGPETGKVQVINVPSKKTDYTKILVPVGIAAAVGLGAILLLKKK
jgi:hypothetical protein